MARLTISLSEPLKARLEARAAEQAMPVSHVVCQALALWLDSEPRLQPASPDVSSEDAEMRTYLLALVRELEQLHRTVDELAVINGPLSHPPPLALSTPPWRVPTVSG